MNRAQLDYLFGADSVGDTPEERAQTSSRRWVRSQDQLSFDSTAAQGLRLSSVEALEIFGIDTLSQLLDYDSAIIVCSLDEPAASLVRCRERLGLSQTELAQRAGITVAQVQRAENTHTRNIIWVLDKICRVLGIDTKRISFERFY
ncbi:MAG: helix-turn-helix transcriptional regulator [Patescibacteria group bacterium]